MTRPLVTIRAAVPADAAAILEVRLASWEAAYRSLLPAGVWAERRRAANPERLRQSIVDGLGALVAEVDETIRAQSFYGASRDNDVCGSAEIFAIYAHPECWSTGVGRALLSATIEALPSRPVTLWVLAANERARRFYERAGFAADGATKPAQLPGGVELPEVRYRLG